MAKRHTQEIPIDQLFPPETVAGRMSVHPSFVHKLIEHGRLTAYKIGHRTVRVSEASIVRYLHTVKAAPSEDE